MNTKKKTSTLTCVFSLRIHQTQPVKDSPSTKPHHSPCLLRSTMPLRHWSLLHRNPRLLYLDQTRRQRLGLSTLLRVKSPHAPPILISPIRPSTSRAKNMSRFQNHSTVSSIKPLPRKHFLHQSPQQIVIFLTSTKQDRHNKRQRPITLGPTAKHSPYIYSPVRPRNLNAPCSR